MFSKIDPTAPGHYDPGQTALLLMDYHSFIIERIPNAQAATTIDAAANMREWARSLGIQVVHCLIDTNATPFPTCKNFDMFKQVVEVLGSEKGKEPAQLLEGDGDVTFVRKPGHVSAMRSPGLTDFLESKGIKSLLLMGLSTSGCVLRTGAAATDLEYVVTTIIDGCADPVDGVHDMLVQSILSQRGYTATSSEFQDGYAKRGSV